MQNSLRQDCCCWVSPLLRPEHTLFNARALNLAMYLRFLVLTNELGETGKETRRFRAHFLQSAAVKSHHGESQLLQLCRVQKSSTVQPNPYQPLSLCNEAIKKLRILTSSKSETRQWKPMALKCRCLRTFWKLEWHFPVHQHGQLVRD